MPRIRTHPRPTPPFAPIPAAALSLDQRIGQLFMVGFAGHEPTPGILDLIARQYVGGIILFTRNLRDARQTLALTSALQAAARDAGHPAPLLIATDQENGLVRRLGTDSTRLPGNMALGATGDPQLAYDVALATGRELRALGINMNLAPDADVNNNPDNPVIGVRSFGEDPAFVSRMVAAATRGYSAAGIIATLKHFPGHGDTTTDSHLARPTLPHTLDRLAAIELPPFEAGIAAGAPAIMTAHLALANVPGMADTPATISADVPRGLLRGRLGFAGVVVTDCLEMGAIRETVGTPRGALLALRAGADIALISHTDELQRSALALVTQAAHAGDLPAEVISLAAERVLALKQRFLSWDTLPSERDLATVGGAPHRALAERAYARTVTVVRDRAPLLPLRLAPEARMMILARVGGHVSQAADASYSHTMLVERIRARHPNTTGHTLERESDLATLDAALAASDLVIVATINAHLDRAQAELVERALATGKRTIALALCDPYDLLAYPAIGTYLATYEYTDPALEAAAAVLFGERPASGHLPVTLSLE